MIQIQLQLLFDHVPELSPQSHPQFVAAKSLIIEYLQNYFTITYYEGCSSVFLEKIIILFFKSNMFSAMDMWYG